jgi:hypothetical protein
VELPPSPPLPKYTVLPSPPVYPHIVVIILDDIFLIKLDPDSAIYINPKESIAIPAGPFT